MLNTTALDRTGKIHSSRRRNQVRSIRLYIEDRLRDPDLSATGIAAALGYSTRYLNRLFEGEPLSVSRFIRERRLIFARRDLTAAASMGRSITDIAYDWGFSSSSHFSHIFRDRFGQCPRQARALGRLLAV